MKKTIPEKLFPPKMTLDNMQLSSLLSDLHSLTKACGAIFIFACGLSLFASAYPKIILVSIILFICNIPLVFLAFRVFIRFLSYRDYLIFARCESAYDALDRLDKHTWASDGDAAHEDCAELIEAGKRSLKPLIRNLPGAQSSILRDF